MQPVTTAVINPTIDEFRYLTFLNEHPPAKLIRTERSTVRYQARKLPAQVLSTEAETFFERLFDRWGLSAARYRDSIFARRYAASQRAMRRLGRPDRSEAIGIDPLADERALDAVMIGVTAFFRDPLVFQELQSHIASLADRACPFKVLSVGCSDGSEIYSTAMLLAERFALDQFNLTGVDCRPAAIEQAKRGVFAATATAAVPPLLSGKFLEPFAAEKRREPHRVRIVASLRERCQWHVGDVFAMSKAGDVAGGYDMILCRNLAIYLTTESASELWCLLSGWLRTGGVLVVGRAERPNAISFRNPLQRIGRCMYLNVRGEC